MKLYKLSIAVALTLLSGTLQAGEPNITIMGRDSVPKPKIIVRSQYDFEQVISLKVRPDPRYIPSHVLIETVSKIGMVDAHGVSITSGFDVDVQHDAVIAFSGGTAEIIKTSRLPDGSLQIISSFKDKNGNYVNPPISQLAAYDTGGKKLCFEYQTIKQLAGKMSFVLLVDRSGSMQPVMQEVRNATAGFLKSLPPSAQCAVASFGDGWGYHNTHYQNCNTGDFKLRTLTANGSSDLYTPLLNNYESLSQPYHDGSQKAVILISDGMIWGGEDAKKKILGVKNGILTFAYFLGTKPEDSYVKGLIDGYIHNPSDVSKNLQNYFQSLSQAYKAQKVLSVKECPAGGSNAP